MPRPLDALRNYYHTGATIGDAQFQHPEWIPSYFDVAKDELPPVAPPTRFQPDPLTVGDSTFGKAVKSLVDLDPLTKQRLANSTITQGPNRDTMRMMSASDLPIDMFNGTNLLGITNINTHNMGINPKLSGEDLRTTIGHELAHVAGYGEGGAQKAERLMSDYVPMGPPRDASDPVDELIKALNRAGIKTK